MGRPLYSADCQEATRYQETVALVRGRALHGQQTPTQLPPPERPRDVDRGGGADGCG
jgi:hypothetical protein